MTVDWSDSFCCWKRSWTINAPTRKMRKEVVRAEVKISKRSREAARVDWDEDGPLCRREKVQGLSSGACGSYRVWLGGTSIGIGMRLE